MLQIKIRKSDTGNLAACFSFVCLFEFRYEPEVGAWLFFVGYKGSAVKKEGRAFPWVYFIDLCRAVAFLKHGEPLWTSEATKVISGKSYVK